LSQSARLKDGSGLAQQLAQVLDRDTHFDVAGLSGDPKGSGASGMPENRERVDFFNAGGQKVDIAVERIRLRSGVWIWLFSSDTIASVPQLVRITSDSPVERHLPDPLVSWTVAGTPLWAWIALVLLALGTAALARLICPLVLRCLEPLLKRVAPLANRSALEFFLAPLRLLVAIAVFQLGMGWIEPSPRVRFYLERLLTLLFFLVACWLFMGVVDLVLIRIRASLLARHHALFYSALPLVSRVSKIAVLLLMIAALLSQWGYNTTTILAGLGVGGIAIALAAQKTIEHFFGGVAVVADRPVAVGDYCRFGDRSGTVEDIGLRSTRIRTPDRTLISVPNGQFSSMTIENFSKRDKMLFHFMLNLRRDTKPDQVRTLLESIRNILETHCKMDTGTFPVHFVGVGTYSLDLEVSVYVLTSDDNEFAEIRQDLLLSILDAVEAAGTALALPTQASIDYSRTTESAPNGTASPREAVKPGSN
jgi:MscS family membrane protein